MGHQIGDAITKDFTTHDPITGQVSNADFLPTCEVYEDTANVPMLTPLVTQRVGHVGNYWVFFVASLANGFEVGSSYNVIVLATVNGILAKARISSFNIESPAGSLTFVV